MPKQIRMPKLSDTMEEGRLIAWRKKVGDSVKRGEVLAEIETDKADMEFEAYTEGTLAQIVVEAGATVPVGTLIAVLRLPGESEEAAAAPAPAAQTQAPAAPSQPAVMRRARASEVSAEASGMPAFRCSAGGMNGFGRAASGQASSVRPLTHSASNSRPADSSAPSTWIGAPGVSGWNSVSPHRPRSRASARAGLIFGATRSSFASSASSSFSLARAWNSAESRLRPGKPAASSSALKCRPHSCGEADSRRGTA